MKKKSIHEVKTCLNLNLTCTIPTLMSVAADNAVAAAAAAMQQQKNSCKKTSKIKLGKVVEFRRKILSRL
jgi:hypothetical protein